MIKLKDLLREQDDFKVDKKPEHEIPSHFGSGKEITVKGYETKHFDICASAVSLFTKLDKVDNEEKSRVSMSEKKMTRYFQ